MRRGYTDAMSKLRGLSLGVGALVIVLGGVAAAVNANKVVAATRAANRAAGMAALKKAKLKLVPAPKSSLPQLLQEMDRGASPGAEMTIDGQRVIVGNAIGMMSGGNDLFVRDAKGVLHLLWLQQGEPRVKKTVRIRVEACGACRAQALAELWWLNEGELGCYDGGAAPPPARHRLYVLPAGEVVGEPISIDHPYTALQALGPPCPPKP